MQIKPKTIYAKGLILIAIPLCVELVFGITMFTLQRYYQSKLDRERNATEIIFHANELWVNCTQLMYVKGYFCFFGGPRPPLEEKMAHLMEGYRLLKKLVADDRTQTANLDRMWLLTNQSLAVGKELVPLASGHSASAKMAALASNIRAMSKVEHFVDAMTPALKSFRAPEFLRSSEAGPEIEKSTRLVDTVVLGSLAASTLVALLLFTYFIRSINRGVNVVIEHTERFKQGKELEAPSGRTDELAQVDTAFHEMAAEIKEAMRAKQAIVSMISHDLRSPLTSVLGYFSSLTSGILGDASPQTIAGAEKCEKEVERLILLINDLLDLDKIDAGKFEMRFKAVSVEKIIDQAINNVSPAAEEKGVTIHGADSSAQILADPDRIVRAVANVLSTAIRLSPPGNFIETGVAESNGKVEVKVTSAGGSISQEALTSLFDRYQQSGADLRLDLPISQEIVKLHGGEIGAAPNDGKGISFWMLLPSPAPAAAAPS